MKTLFAAGIITLVSIAIFTPWLIGEQRGSRTSSAVEATYPLAFPDHFDWGVAVAAQHVENQQPSDWTAFEQRVIAESKTGTGDKPGQARPGHIRDLDKYPAEVRQKKVDFDARYESDFKELAKLNETLTKNGNNGLARQCLVQLQRECVKVTSLLTRCS